jgi:hypothetical protein
LKFASHFGSFRLSQGLPCKSSHASSYGEGSKWTRGDRPVPKGRVAQIIELTDFVAEHGAAAVPLPSLVRTANARPRLVRPAVTRQERIVSPPAELRPETRAGFGPLHSDFVRAHNLASQRGFER